MLKAWRGGDLSARDQLFDLLYRELTILSAAILNGEGPISLTSGDLVHEAAMRLVRLDRIDWQDRAHFLAMAARMMRRVLIDRARAKQADKRYHIPITLVTDFLGHGQESIRQDLLDKVLVRLKVADPDAAQIVELRYFGNLSIEETAEVVGISPSGVKRKWRAARAWLSAVLAQNLEDGAI